MTELSKVDQKLRDQALQAYEATRDEWPVNMGWKPSWIGTGVDRSNPDSTWRCQNKRTVIFTSTYTDDSEPSDPHFWTLHYIPDSGFGRPINGRHAPPTSELFNDIVRVYS